MVASNAQAVMEAHVCSMKLVAKRHATAATSAGPKQSGAPCLHLRAISRGWCRGLWRCRPSRVRVDEAKTASSSNFGSCAIAPTCDREASHGGVVETIAVVRRVNSFHRRRALQHSSGATFLSMMIDGGRCLALGCAVLAPILLRYGGALSIDATRATRIGIGLVIVYFAYELIRYWRLAIAAELEAGAGRINPPQ